MKFLVLLADDGFWETADDAQRAAVMEAHVSFAKVAGERARIEAGEALAGSDEAVHLRPAADGSSRVVTDGPYAESAEQLGGFYLIEADSRDVVVDLCRVLPPNYAIEIWPTVDIDLEGT